VPVAELARTALAFGAGAVALSVTYVGPDGAHPDVLCALRAELPRQVAVLAGGSGSGTAKRCDDVTLLPDSAALRRWLRSAGPV
jgi:hypothetical protein